MARQTIRDRRRIWRLNCSRTALRSLDDAEKAALIALSRETARAEA
jgi:hypothetical protein